MRPKALPTRRAAAAFSCAGPTARTAHKELECAKTILSTLMRRAYRRPVSKEDVEGPLAQYREGRADGDFDAGIARALSAVLINPEFLFRVEADPASAKATAGKPASVVTASPISSSRRGSRSSCGAASRTMSCSMRRFAAGSAGPRSSRSRRAECSPIDGRSTWRPILPASGCGCAISTLSCRARGCFPSSMTTCARASGRKRSCLSTASCARIAACSI